MTREHGREILACGLQSCACRRSSVIRWEAGVPDTPSLRLELCLQTMRSKSWWFCKVQNELASLCKWRMCTPDGVLFGECLWASIRVDATATTPPIDLECKFVADDSIPDGTTMKPHEKFEKKWVVKTGETSCCSSSQILFLLRI